MAISKMWRSPIFEKNNFPAENAGNMPEKPVFWHFLDSSSLVFSDFLHKDAYYSNAQNMAEPDFWERIFSGQKCRKSPFLQIFIGLFPYISLFFHTETLLITMPTIKHGSIVNKTDFWSRNFLKIAGTADFRRKNGISWISQAVYFIFFSRNFPHLCKMTIPKIFSKNCRNSRLSYRKNEFYSISRVLL